MDKAETIKALCALCTKVADSFEDSVAHDCFCEDSPWPHASYHMNPRVIDFIRAAVEKAIGEK